MKYEHEPYRDDRDATLRLKARSKEPKLGWKEYLPYLALIALIALLVVLAITG
jgi:hypothetical protein